MTKKSTDYMIGGAGVLYINSSKYLQSDEGKKQIELLKKIEARLKQKQKDSIEKSAQASSA